MSYTLSDMARDTIGLLDALGIERAHIVGASMGGAIAQTIAIEHPTRIGTLTSIMSTTGNPSVGRTHPDVLRQLFSGGAVTTRDEAIAQAVRAAQIHGANDRLIDPSGGRATAELVSRSTS